MVSEAGPFLKLFSMGLAGEGHVMGVMCRPYCGYEWGNAALACIERSDKRPTKRGLQMREERHRAQLWLRSLVSRGKHSKGGSAGHCGLAACHVWLPYLDFGCWEARRIVACSAFCPGVKVVSHSTICGLKDAEPVMCSVTKIVLRVNCGTNYCTQFSEHVIPTLNQLEHHNESQTNVIHELVQFLLPMHCKSLPRHLKNDDGQCSISQRLIARCWDGLSPPDKSNAGDWPMSSLHVTHSFSPMFYSKLSVRFETIIKKQIATTKRRLLLQCSSCPPAGNWSCCVHCCDPNCSFDQICCC